MVTDEMKLQGAINEAKFICEGLGIEYGNISKVELKDLGARTWGRCISSSRSKPWSDVNYTINISKKLFLKGVSHEALMNTVIHEVLHTCEYCMNHGVEWKRLADKVNKKYPQFHIERCTNQKAKGLTEEQILNSSKYALKCDGCGVIYPTSRYTTSIKHPEWYCCKCGGKFTRIK